MRATTRSRQVRRRATALLALVLASAAPATAAGWTLVGWNNLGMHCMDGDYAVFSLLPPYNTFHAQLVDPQGTLVRDPAARGITVSYQAVADPGGSVNTTSAGKTDFWDHVLALFGVALPVDTGLVFEQHMPGAGNVPQPMRFDAANGWFVAEGVPITPYDDTGAKNFYPLMRLVARAAGGAVLATTDIVLPVSDEMDCRTCHASGSGAAARPAAGWVNHPDAERDFRLNVLRLHDDRQLGDSVFQAALVAAGYDRGGLFATATVGTSILCANCHLSEALPGSGRPGIAPLTQVLHGRHADVVDPLTGLPLDASANRGACYRCHPGSETRCLRGAMGAAVAPDGTLAMQCQSCHGSMRDVASPARTGWLDEPGCASCHTGTAVLNSGQIRFTTVFDAIGHMREAADATFATTPDAPAPGLSLYRFSTGHGGLKCEACHGSTHAEFPTTHQNDNLQSIALQGHAGMLSDCTTCHASQPQTVSGGPHGMHPIGQSWVERHGDAAEDGRAGQCKTCHGTDYRGTELSRALGDRTLDAFGTKHFWRGFQIGCYGCHAGPNDEDRNPNHAPVADDATLATTTDTPASATLVAHDADGQALDLRIVSQPAHGTTALAGTTATYFPESGFAGSDAFTFAAWDGQTNSNLATVTVSVGGTPGCVYAVTPASVAVDAGGGSVAIAVTAAAGCEWSVAANVGWITVEGAASGSGAGEVTVGVAPNPDATGRTGTFVVAGQQVTIAQRGNGPAPDLTAQWLRVAQRCTGAGATRCRVRGRVAVVNQGDLKAGRSKLELYLSDDTRLDPSDQLVRTLRIPMRRPGTRKRRSVVLRLPRGTSASGRVIIAVVDAAGAVAEGDESNNVVASPAIP